MKTRTGTILRQRLANLTRNCQRFGPAGRCSSTCRGCPTSSKLHQRRRLRFQAARVLMLAPAPASRMTGLAMSPRRRLRPLSEHVLAPPTFAALAGPAVRLALAQRRQRLRSKSPRRSAPSATNCPMCRATCMPECRRWRATALFPRRHLRSGNGTGRKAGPSATEFRVSICLAHVCECRAQFGARRAWVHFVVSSIVVVSSVACLLLSPCEAVPSTRARVFSRRRRPTATSARIYKLPVATNG